MQQIIMILIVILHSLIDTNLIRTIHTTPISERRFDCYEPAYEIHSANQAFESRIAERICTARGGNDRHRRNRTEREGRKRGGEESEGEKSREG